MESNFVCQTIIDVEIDNLKKMGECTSRQTALCARQYQLQTLKQKDLKEHLSVLGVYLPNFMNIPGENSINIMSLQ